MSCSGRSGQMETIGCNDMKTAVSELTDQLYEDDLNIDREVVFKLIGDLSNSRPSEEVMDTVVMDFLMALIARQPGLITEPVLDQLITYWTKCRVQSVICPRHLSILSEQSRSPIQSWNKYETVIVKMLSKGVTTAAAVESDALRTLRDSWSDSTLSRFASCMKSVSLYVRQNNLIDRNQELDESETMEWLSWLCSQTDHN